MNTKPQLVARITMPCNKKTEASSVIPVHVTVAQLKQFSSSLMF